MKKVRFIASIMAIVFMLSSCYRGGCPGKITMDENPVIVEQDC